MGSRSAVIVAAAIVALLLLPATAFAGNVYRFYNARTGAHLYTASEAEKASVVAGLARTFRYEGVAYAVDASDPSNVAPLHRFYNSKRGTHFFTASETEKANVLKNLSSLYRYEGVAYNVSLMPTNGTPVFRFYNKRSGGHFFTASAWEKACVMANLPAVYTYEGIAFWLAGASNGPFPAPGLYDQADGTTRAVGFLAHVDLEGGFWAVVANAPTEGAGNAPIVAVVVPGADMAAEMQWYRDKYVSVVGTMYYGPNIWMAGPVLKATHIEAMVE